MPGRVVLLHRVRAGGRSPRQPAVRPCPDRPRLPQRAPAGSRRAARDRRRPPRAHAPGSRCGPPSSRCTRRESRGAGARALEAILSALSRAPLSRAYAHRRGRQPGFANLRPPASVARDPPVAPVVSAGTRPHTSRLPIPARRGGSRVLPPPRSPPPQLHRQRLRSEPGDVPAPLGHQRSLRASDAMPVADPPSVIRRSPTPAADARIGVDRRPKPGRPPLQPRAAPRPHRGPNRRRILRSRPSGARVPQRQLPRTVPAVRVGRPGRSGGHAGCAALARDRRDRAALGHAQELPRSLVHGTDCRSTPSRRGRASAEGG